VTLKERIEAIEAGYEFMLAYAAQGRSTDQGGGGVGANLRELLHNMDTALDGLGKETLAATERQDPELVETSHAFFDAIHEDARRAQGVIRLVLGQEDISSQLIDNVNASIHLRALLTDLFVIDEALKGS